MNSVLCITIRFLQPFCHARGERGEPEWPPSPLRMIQALVASGAGCWNERSHISEIEPTIRWLEAMPPPRIIATPGFASNVRYQLYVPDNSADLLVPAWDKGETTKQPKRTEKIVRPTHLAGDSVHYLYALMNDGCPHLTTLCSTARAITHLGWGIDMAIGDASVISGEEAAGLPGHRWTVSPTGGTPLRVPKRGTLDDLNRKHADFLGRVTHDGFRPVPPLRVFDVVQYRRDDLPSPRPYRLFELRSSDGTRMRYPHRRMVHLAGMVRHLAIEAMRDKERQPRGVGDDWAEKFVAGHRDDSRDNHNGVGYDAQATRSDNVAGRIGHRQLSYLPLPSIGHEYADPGVRRVMIAAPVGDEAWLDHVARRLGVFQNFFRKVFGVQLPSDASPGIADSLAQ